MTRDAARIAAYLRRLADLVDGTDEPVECHIVDDGEIGITEGGRTEVITAGGAAVAIIIGETRDALVRRISAELEG